MRSKPRLILYVVVLIWLAVPSGPSNGSTACTLESTEPVSTVEVASELGISPSGAVIACLPVGDVAVITAVLGRIDEKLEMRLELAVLQAQAASVSSEMTQLTSALMLEPNNNQLTELLNQTISQQIALEAQIDATLDELWAHAVNELSPTQIDSLERWRSLLAYKKVPAEFKVSDRPDEAWQSLEAALHAEVRSIQSGLPLAPEHAALLGSVRAEPAVINAKQLLDLHLAAVEQVFGDF